MGMPVVAGVELSSALVSCMTGEPPIRVSPICVFVEAGAEGVALRALDKYALATGDLEKLRELAMAVMLGCDKAEAAMKIDPGS